MDTVIGIFDWERRIRQTVSLDLEMAADIRKGAASDHIDDALDYSADQDKLGKSVGDDFAEGKVTLPVLLAFERGDEDQQAFWRRTIERLDQKDGDLAHAKALIAEHNAIVGTVEAAERYGAKAKAALNGLPTLGGSAEDIRNALEDVITFCLIRGH